MAGLIGLGKASQGRALATLKQGAQSEFQRNQANEAMAANKRAQEMSTMGMGGGTGAYYGVQQGAAGTAAGGGSTLTAANTAGAIGKEAVLMETATAGSQAAAGGTAAGGTAAGGSAAGGALSTAATALPYIAAGIAVAALFNKLFD